MKDRIIEIIKNNLEIYDSMLNNPIDDFRIFE